jgi:hypothetical protein
MLSSVASLGIAFISLVLAIVTFMLGQGDRTIRVVTGVFFLSLAFLFFLIGLFPFFPTPIPENTSPERYSGGYCFGQCWQYDETTKTMTWIGPIDGTEDIWQGDELSLGRIRGGWIAVFGPVTVPGEIEACILKIDERTVVSTCDGVQHPYQVEANQMFHVTSTSSEVGGFRWKPARGFGYNQ